MRKFSVIVRLPKQRNPVQRALGQSKFVARSLPPKKGTGTPYARKGRFDRGIEIDGIVPCVECFSVPIHTD